MSRAYIEKYGYWQEGPCTLCGLRGYDLSMGGPAICPACDVGYGYMKPDGTMGHRPRPIVDNSPEAIAKRKQFSDALHEDLKKAWAEEDAKKEATPK